MRLQHNCNTQYSALLLRTVPATPAAPAAASSAHTCPHLPCPAGGHYLWAYYRPISQFVFGHEFGHLLGFEHANGAPPAQVLASGYAGAPDK